MTLTYILIFAAAAIPFMRLVPARGRPWGLLAGSVLAMGWLQSASEAAESTYLLPLATVILTIVVWWIVRPAAPEQPAPAEYRRDTWLALAITGAALAVIWLLAPYGDRPDLAALLPGAALAGVAAISASHLLGERVPDERLAAFQRLAALAIGVIVLLLLVIKWPALSRALGGWLHAEPQIGIASFVTWLGFSYIAFRLIGVLLDFRAGQLPAEGFSLRDMLVYTLFFPAFTAGPIDRAQRFIPELDQALPLDSFRLVEGTARIAIGVFKKFVVADSLALVAMSPALIDQTDGIPGLWLLVYLYALQIFFDFSGYSDVAIGLGRLYGITLPENFDRPYLQSNIQQFWNRWHITLSLWFRVYFFTPLSRALLRRHISPTLGVFVAQISTMLLIGLWHGVTWNFILWGLWHGLGLFLFKLWSDRTRMWYLNAAQRPRVRRAITVFGVLVTFHFVALGWVFFALPTPADSFEMLARLFGIRG